MTKLKFGHTGDIGDLMVSLPTIQQMGGGSIYFMDKPRCRPFTPRLPVLKRLLESQDYITAVLPHKGEKLDYDFSDFRCNGMPFGVQLGKLHSDYVGFPTDFSKPWLSVEPSRQMTGRIIINKTCRYGNHFFPWTELVKMFHAELLFVGLSGEYRDFCEKYGKVPYLPTSDLLHVAESIAGADLFIGNQSSPNAICEGLKHNCVQEVSLTVPDCIYPRENAIHCHSGSLEFIACGQHFKYIRQQKRKTVIRSVTPLGGWKFTVGSNRLNHYDFQSIILMAQREFQASQKPIPNNIPELIERETFPIQEEIPDPPQIEKVARLIDSLYVRNSHILLSGCS